jgi:hypothetical protein
VVDGLRKNRKICVRKPGEDEKNANKLLIEKGAVAVDFDGMPVPFYGINKPEAAPTLFKEPEADYERPILEMLKKGKYTVMEIKAALKIEWSDDKLRKYLKVHQEVEEIRHSPLQYTHIGRPKPGEVQQRTLFDD